MERTVTTVIDQDLCNGCGLCVSVCPKDTITMVNGLAQVTGSESLNCGHCEAVCPQNAIRVEGLDPSMSRFRSFDFSREWLPFRAFDTGTLVRLMLSRRSCRNYLPAPVDRALLDDLVKIGATAPSGSNCQLWSFTILPDRDSVLALGRQVGDFFKKINRLSEKTLLRTLMRLVGKPALSEYYETYYISVKEALSRWEDQGKDLLFHGATAVIIVGSRNGATCPAEDALLATQNILLAAHCMGLGTCLVGYAVEAMKRNRHINQSLGIPSNETSYAVIALGYPDETYMRVSGRKRVMMRYANPRFKESRTHGAG